MKIATEPGRVLEKHDRAHDLPALAVATLHDVVRYPSVLHRLADGIPADRLDGHHGPIADHGYRDHAGTCGHASHVHRAGAASADAAAVFGARHLQVFAQHPEQWG